ncbi:hypothetical protein RBA41_14075 [Massilia sp. CCM 9210]|uniref:hypothetical protein n=1 Tax=Massilia scottii TaxID=3057166 RepID=UPI00279644E4|nr:hypothetical protein [Massilia sp. CCM 9210]MDQ1814435.1 hypothetical protein [Massilia sp. CCM 9210]
MNTAARTLYEDRLDTLANAYANDGYAVVKHPTAEQLPFDLFGYVPDLLAIKGDSGLIVEARTSAACTSVDHFRAIAQEIAEHPGWRFVLVTVDDADAANLPERAGDLPTWAQLIEKLNQVDVLVDDGALEPGVLYLGSLFEAALRKRAFDQHIPIERFPPAMLLDHMYSQGEVSVNDIDFFHELMNIRNRIAHGANTTLDAGTARKLAEAVRKLVTEEWNETPPRQG